VTRRRSKDPLLADLRNAVKAVLSDAKATPAEKLKAIEAGSKLLMIQHKISDREDEGGNFFG